MIKRLLLKLVSRVPLLIGITFISFLMIHLAPGRPGAAGQELNPQMDSAARQKMEALYGLDRPVLEQYATWLSRLARLDLGESFMDGQKVTEKILQSIPVTLSISLSALLLVFLLGVPLGVLSARHEGCPLDRALSLFSSGGIAMPVFWLSLMCLSFFGVTLRWLPVSGLHSLFSEERSAWWRFADTARHLVLPVCISALGGIAAISRYARSGFLHELKQDYVRTARAKGLSEPAVMYRHALRNALLPLITLLGLSIPGLVGGSVVVETIFSIPGMGRLFFNSVFTRDYPVIMGILVLGAVLTLLGNALADVLYATADPRIRKETAHEE